MASALSLLSASWIALLFFSTFSIATPGVVSIPFEKRASIGSDSPLKIRKRAGTAEGIVDDPYYGMMYTINIAVGDPPQSLQVQIDTGSSDFWVPSTKSPFCQHLNCSLGTYDQTKSSTYTALDEDVFQTLYGDSDTDGSGAEGYFMKETVTIGDVSFKDLLMGLATNGSVPAGGETVPFPGVMGVSYAALEYGSVNENKTYPTIVSQMVTQGAINTEAYSLWLNDLNSTQGTLLFGGVDTTKYTGNLVTLPIQDDASLGANAGFWVTFAALELEGKDGKTVFSATTNAPVLLDSGTPDTILPSDLAEGLARGIGGNIASDGTFTIPCTVANSEGIFKFQFGSVNGPVISIPISEYVGSPTGMKLPNGDDGCEFGISSSATIYILGDNFLRSAYTVFNIAGNQIAIAEAKFDVTSSNIIPITATDSIPGASSTATGDAVSTASFIYSSQTPSGKASTWDLGTPTGAAASGSKTGGTSASKTAAAAGVLPPSVSFVGTAVLSIVLLFTLSGSAMILI